MLYHAGTDHVQNEPHGAPSAPVAWYGTFADQSRSGKRKTDHGIDELRGKYDPAPSIDSLVAYGHDHSMRRFFSSKIAPYKRAQPESRG